MAKLFLLDDQPVCCQITVRLLTKVGHDVQFGHDAGAIHQALTHWSPDLALLDVELGDDNGCRIARDLRRVSAIPVLMLTSRTDLACKLEAFEAGADDYLCKPYLAEELVARTGALLRRAALSSFPSSSPGHAGITLDRHRRLLCVATVGSLPLTEVECAVLDLLLQHSGRPLSREALCRAVLRRRWTPGERGLDVHVSNLRRKLKAFAPCQLQIQSVRGIGYRLVLLDEPFTAS